MIFDRNGDEMSLREYMDLMVSLGPEAVEEYVRVARTTFMDGAYVSTVWMGNNHRILSDGPPLIFETMVFAEAGNILDRYQVRYSTEREALIGHYEVLALCRLKWPERAIFEDWPGAPAKKPEATC